MKLQEMDLALETIRVSKASVAPRRIRVQADQAQLVSAFEESKKSLQQALLDKKKMEGDVEAKEQAIRKHTGELNSVKSNDAYKALLTEIETAKKEKAAAEDRILEIMELQDNLQKDLKEREKTLDADKAALAKQVDVLDAEEKELDGRLAAKQAERDAAVQSVPANALQRYEGVRRGRSTFAVLAAVKDLTCQGCRTRIPADVVNNVMKGKEIVSCESCSRILFILPAEPAPAAQ